MKDSDLVGIQEIAVALGISRNAVDQRRKQGTLPKPDQTISGRPAWKWRTIRTWAEKTGRELTD